MNPAPPNSAMQSVSASILVLNHNRREILARVLRAACAQNLPGLEWIVVDNGSTDGSAEMVREGFPDVRVVALDQNAGIRGRNIGFQEARGRVVLSLDNDIELLDPDLMQRVLRRFDADPQLGAATLKICEESTGDDFAPPHWWHPKSREQYQDDEFDTDNFNEAAVAFRASAIREAGYYYEPLFWGGEEWDLSLGLMDAGYAIRYVPEPVLHLAPRGNLNTQANARHALLVRNRFWIAFRRLPVLPALGYVLPRLALWTVRSLRYGYFREFARGLWDFARRLPETWRSRRLVSRDTRLRIRALRTEG